MRILYQLTSPMEKTLGGSEIERRLGVLQRAAATGTEVDIRSIANGPGSIESDYDAALVVPELLKAVPEAAKSFDAVIVGCFSDPGLDPLREKITTPIIGPGASALHLAAQLGGKISVISPGSDGGGRAAARMRALGLADKYVSTRGVAMSVLDVAQQRETALDAIAEAGKRIAQQDGADILVLGCMSMAFLEITEELQHRVGLPVVNPVAAGLKAAETVASMGLTHSRVAYPEPPLKEIL